MVHRERDAITDLRVESAHLHMRMQAMTDALRDFDTAMARVLRALDARPMPDQPEPDADSEVTMQKDA